MAFEEKALPDALDVLRRQPGLQEGMILSTCNRVEVAVTADESADAESAVEQFLSESRKLDRGFVTPYLYKFDGANAIRHVFRVASSLDSMVVGEPQILGQLKSAYALWDEVERASGRTLFHRTGLVIFGPESGVTIRSSSMLSVAIGSAIGVSAKASSSLCA